MYRFTLDLRLDASTSRNGVPVAYCEESESLRTRIYTQLRLKPHSAKAWVTLDLESSKGWGIVQKLVDECQTGRVRVGRAIACEKVDIDADWFQLVTKMADDSFSLWDDYPSFKAGTHPDGHALNEMFVSEAFVELVARAKLTGISFLRCRNKGRKAGPSWFVALPAHSLGLGLDHPWFDRKRWLRDVTSASSKRTSSLNAGQSEFHQCWLRDALGADAEFVNKLLTLCPTPQKREVMQGLEFVTAPRYWSGAHPDADFAFLPFGEDGTNAVGKMLRFRKLAVSRRARRALVDAGLFKQKSFLPLRSIATPEKHVEILDQKYDAPPPMYTPEELAVLREHEQRIFNP